MSVPGAANAFSELGIRDGRIDQALFPDSSVHWPELLDAQAIPGAEPGLYARDFARAGDLRRLYRQSALQGDGEAVFARNNSALPTPLTTAGTVLALLRIDDLAAENVVAAVWNSDGDRRAWYVRVDDGRLLIGISSDGTAATVSERRVRLAYITAGAVHQVGFRFAAGDLRAVIDGRLLADDELEYLSDEAGEAIHSPAWGLSLGAYNDGVAGDDGGWLDGAAIDARIWHEALEETEIVNQWNNAPERSTPAHWYKTVSGLWIADCGSASVATPANARALAIQGDDGGNSLGSIDWNSFDDEEGFAVAGDGTHFVDAAGADAFAEGVRIPALPPLRTGEAISDSAAFTAAGERIALDFRGQAPRVAKVVATPILHLDDVDQRVDFVAAVRDACNVANTFAVELFAKRLAEQTRRVLICGDGTTTNRWQLVWTASEVRATLEDSSGQVSTSMGQTLETGEEYRLRVSWDATSRQLRLWVDDQEAAGTNSHALLTIDGFRLGDTDGLGAYVHSLRISSAEAGGESEAVPGFFRAADAVRHYPLQEASGSQVYTVKGPLGEAATIINPSEANWTEGETDRTAYNLLHGFRQGE